MNRSQNGIRVFEKLLQKWLPVLTRKKSAVEIAWWLISPKVFGDPKSTRVDLKHRVIQSIQPRWYDALFENADDQQLWVINDSIQSGVGQAVGLNAID